MGINLNWTGPSYIGVTSYIVDANGIPYGVGHEVGTGTTAPGIGGMGGTAWSGSVLNAAYGFNTTFVPKSSSSINLPKTNTQVYMYTFMDQAGYALQNGWNYFPFRQKYEVKKSTVEEEDFELYTNIAASRSADFLASTQGPVVKVGRLPFLHPTAFTGVLSNRSEPEYTEADVSLTIEVTASMEFNSVPTTSQLNQLLAMLNQNMAASSAVFGAGVNTLLPPIQWDNITREPLHPIEEGNYYPYKSLVDYNFTGGLLYDVFIIPGLLAQVRPEETFSLEDAFFNMGWYFGLGVGSGDDRLLDTSTRDAFLLGAGYPPGFTNFGGQTFVQRRDPLYRGIPDFQPMLSANLTYANMINLLTRGNSGRPYLPSQSPTGTVQGYRSDGSSFNYPYSTFLQNAANFNSISGSLPRVVVTAKVALDPGAVKFTKGTYSHIEVPKVKALGNEYTPSVVICHNAQKMYFMYYAYQDNKQCIAYNVLDNCEEDDKRTYVPQTTVPPPLPPPLPGVVGSGPVLPYNPGPPTVITQGPGGPTQGN